MSPSGGRRSQRPWLVVNLGFTPHGGQDLANYALAKEIAARGRELTLVAHDVSLDLRSSDGVTVVEVPRPFGSNFLGERLLARIGLRTFRRHPRQREMYFLGNGGSCPGATVSWAHFVHSAWSPQFVSGTPVSRRVASTLRARDARAREFRAFGTASLVVTNSDRTTRDIERSGIPGAKIRRIYLGSSQPGLDRRDPARKRVKPFLLFLGALGWDSRKGLDIAMEAFALLARTKAFRHRLVVAGNGSTTPWRRLASSLGIADRVEFVGFVPEPEALIRDADLLVSPVRYEPYGLALQEALCLGVPLLVSSRAGIVERLSGADERMVVAEHAKSPEWAERIQEALEGLSELRSTAQRAGRELGKRQWRDFAAEFIEAVERSLE